MKTARVIVSCVCIILVPLLRLTPGYNIHPAFPPDQPFDTYGGISWEDEKAHLDNFAIALQQEPNQIGYIIVYAGRRSCVGEAKDRALRAKKYLIEVRNIQEARIKWIDGGYREELTVVLQPVPPNAPEILPSPTVKSSDVQIIKKCRPKTAQPKNRDP